MTQRLPVLASALESARAAAIDGALEATPGPAPPLEGFLVLRKPLGSRQEHEIGALLFC
jgi:hypothetical protein